MCRPGDQQGRLSKHEIKTLKSKLSQALTGTEGIFTIDAAGMGRASRRGSDWMTLSLCIHRCTLLSTSTSRVRNHLEQVLMQSYCDAARVRVQDVRATERTSGRS